jgi:hypothetical protein
MFETDVDRLLAPYAPPVSQLARDLLRIILEIRPDLVPKCSFGWQTINFHHPRAAFVIALYLSRTGTVGLVFQDGRLLDSPLLVDNGKVKKVRWIPFVPGDAIPVDDIAILIAETIALRV